MNKKKIQGYVRTKYPLDKFKRHIIYKDRRKANIKEKKLNDMISKQKYNSKLLEKLIKSNHEIRMFFAQRRDAATLIPIIRKNAKMGSDIHSDEWRAYSKEGHRIGTRRIRGY